MYLWSEATDLCIVRHQVACWIHHLQRRNRSSHKDSILVIVVSISLVAVSIPVLSWSVRTCQHCNWICCTGQDGSWYNRQLKNFFMYFVLTIWECVNQIILLIMNTNWSPTQLLITSHGNCSSIIWTDTMAMVSNIAGSCCCLLSLSIKFKSV